MLKKFQEHCQKHCRKDIDKEVIGILTWGLGISGEAGDVASCIKKTFMHDNDQRAGIRENLGDVMWYIAMICNHFDWNMEEILKENMEKLDKRYPNGFSYEAAKRKPIDWGK